MKKIKKKRDKLEIPVIRGKVLGVHVYRGYGRLCDLAKISRADIYDQSENPQGTQRDLSPGHARAAYEYIKAKDLAFWPEVFLCARKKEVITYTPLDYDLPDIGLLTVDMSIATDPQHVAISRVDGNHRLHYADGADPKYSPIEKTGYRVNGVGPREVSDMAWKIAICAP